MKNKLTKKIVIMSRYMVIGTFLQCVFMSLLSADNLHAQRQSIDEIHVSINVDGNVLEVFKAIESVTDFKFTVNNTRLNYEKQISIHAVNRPLKDVLESISKKTELKFRRINENISVSNLEKAEPRVMEEQANLQGHTITGKVTTSDEPVRFAWCKYCYQGHHYWHGDRRAGQL